MAWSLDYYNGRAVDINGKPIGTEYHEGDFVAERFEPDDLPVFESETEYLKRHRLFAVVEVGRLRANAFDLEVLPAPLWPT
jgi:hypothetical protein